MGAWDNGMLENDTAGDAICDFETRLAKLITNGRVIDPVTLPKLLAEAVGAPEYSAGLGTDNSLAVLGIAEHLRSYGVGLRAIKGAIKAAVVVELQKENLKVWRDPRKRKNALNLFASRVGV